MPTYYRYGYQAYPYQSNWQGVPWHSSKPPHMMFGDITPSRSEKHLLLLAALAGAVYFVAIRKPKGGKTLLQKWMGKKKRKRRRNPAPRISLHPQAEKILDDYYLGAISWTEAKKRLRKLRVQVKGRRKPKRRMPKKGRR